MRQSVRLSVCLSVCAIPLAQQRCILGFPRWKSNPLVSVEVTEMATKPLTSEAFAKWLHNRQGPITAFVRCAFVDLPSAAAFRFACS